MVLENLRSRCIESVNTETYSCAVTAIISLNNSGSYLGLVRFQRTERENVSQLPKCLTKKLKRSISSDF